MEDSAEKKWPLPKFFHPVGWMWVLLLVLSAVSLLFTALFWLFSSALFYLSLLIAIVSGLAAMKTLKWRGNKLPHLTKDEIKTQYFGLLSDIFWLITLMLWVLQAAFSGDVASMLFPLYLSALLVIWALFSAFGYGLWRRPGF